MKPEIHQMLFLILDTEKDSFVSSSILDLRDEEREFIKKKVQKVLSSDQRKAYLNSDEKHNLCLKQFELSKFEEISLILGQSYFNLKKEKGLYELSDLFFVDFNAEGINYYLMLDLPLKKALTHQIDFIEDRTVNHLIETAVLGSDLLVKEDSFILLDWKDQNITVKDQRLDVNGSLCKLMENHLFDLSASPTLTETVSFMEKTVKEISNKYEFDLKEILPQFKSAVEDCEFLEAKTMAKKVFEKSPVASEEFRISMENSGYAEPVAKEGKPLPKKDRTMKFVTESGIEIIVPSSYLKRKDKIEIHQNPDGTTSISIKNIEKLNNR